MKDRIYVVTFEQEGSEGWETCGRTGRKAEALEIAHERENDALVDGCRNFVTRIVTKVTGRWESIRYEKTYADGRKVSYRNDL